MNSVEEAKREVEGLESKLRSAEADLLQLAPDRPRHALAAERGDGKGLETFDREVDAKKQRIESLYDAIHAAKFQIQVARACGIIRYVEKRKAAGQNLRKQLSNLVDAIGQVRLCNTELEDRARELGERVNGPDLTTAVLLELGRAFDLGDISRRVSQIHAQKRSEAWTEQEWELEIKRQHAGLIMEFPHISLNCMSLEEEDSQLDLVLGKLQQRAKSKGPKKRMQTRPEDQPIGGLAALTAMNAPAAGRR
ncbi:MAG: hypothetical protein ABSG54_08355 [Terriglobia bacterium]|jgi:hypothetical protein